MDLIFPFNIVNGPFSEQLIAKGITTPQQLADWLFHLDLDHDQNDRTEQLVLDKEKASNLAKNAFFARISVENGQEKNRFFVGFTMINANLVPEMATELASLPHTAMPVVLAYIKCGDQRITVGNDQAIIDLLGKFIVREHHVDPHQGFEWRQMMYDDYLTRFIDRNNLTQSVEELKSLKDIFFNLKLEK